MSVLDALPLPEVYYHPRTKSYWRLDAHRKYIAINETALKAYLKSQGFAANAPKGTNLGEIDQCMLNIQSHQNVDYVGPLAGYMAGLYTINTHAVLVTQSPRLIIPQAGEWPMLQRVIEGMFDATQRLYLYGWLKMAMETYASHTWTPGQIMVIAGPPDSAKSLLQRLFTVLFGGRSAKPYASLNGATNFNSEIFGAEHLIFEDDNESTDIRSRRKLGAGLKGIAVNTEHYCHGKNNEALTLTPIWRMSVSVNDDPERLQVIPPLDTDIADKIIFLKAVRQEMPMPAKTASEKRAFLNTLVAELPAFLHFLTEWQIPEALQEPRFGIRYYHHPDLVDSLSESTPHAQLLALIDNVLFPMPIVVGQSPAPWEGTAVELENRLTLDGCPVRDQARRLLTHGARCGSYLGKLEGDYPARFSKRKTNGHNRWTINPPAMEVIPDAGGEGELVATCPPACPPTLPPGVAGN